jgi:hypothetical protein
MLMIALHISHSWVPRFSSGAEILVENQPGWAPIERYRNRSYDYIRPESRESCLHDRNFDACSAEWMQMVREQPLKRGRGWRLSVLI